jgi:hypothetical protein
MKTFSTSKTLFFFSVLFLCTFLSCKKTAEDSSCKTCTARSRTSEQVLKQQQACTTAEEDIFRSQYPEATVTCQ